VEKYKYVEIGGAQVKLTEKVCQGGCGQAFWGLEKASNICEGCSKKTPEQRAKKAAKKAEAIKAVKIFGYDGVTASIPREQKLTESKSKPVQTPVVEKKPEPPLTKPKEKKKEKKAIVDTTLYSITLDGVVIDNIRRSDYEIIDLFIKNPQPLSINDLFDLFYGIPVDKQQEYPTSELQMKRVTLVNKISRARRLIENKLGGIWFGQKKGYWKFKGRPEVDKVATISAIDEERKSTPRARSDIKFVDKALDALSEKISDVSNTIKDKAEDTSEDISEDVALTEEPISELVEDKSEEVKVEDSSENDELRWQKCIERAKSIKEMVRNNRLILADIAMEACDIVWGGGGHWNNYSEQRTVNNFGAAIGVNAKTLYEWIRVKKFVVDKLPPADYSAPKLWKILRAVQEKVTRDTESDKVQEIYQRELTREGPNLQIKRVIKATKSTKQFVKKTDLSVIHKEDLEELKTTCWEIVNEMETKMSERQLPLG